MTYEAPGDTNQAIAEATSLGSPDLPIGVRSPCSYSGFSWEPVVIHPGATALAVTPNGASSIAMARAKPTIAAFADA